jgi:hypothetical protein
MEEQNHRTGGKPFSSSFKRSKKNDCQEAKTACLIRRHLCGAAPHKSSATALTPSDKEKPRRSGVVVANRSRGDQPMCRPPFTEKSAPVA